MFDWDAPRIAVSIVLCLAAAGLTTLVCGCGGPPRETRVAIEQLGRGLNVTDEAVTAEISARGPAARAQVRQEVAAGSIADIDAGLERFEALMAPTTEARAALATTRHVLETAEASLDAWAAGTGDEGGFLASAACALGALNHLAGVLQVLDIDLPPEVLSAMGAIGSLAGGMCPEPAEDGDPDA